MFARGACRVLLASFSILAFSVAAPLRAQDATPPDVENSKYQIIGMVNGNAVYVRSGASDNAYATAKLDKGAEVTVVGEKFDWLKIQPPAGSFCYVAKAYVNRAGNGSIGQVTNALNVRMGSSLSPLKTMVVDKLEANQRVEIIGEQDEYWKIKPTPGVSVYIKKEFVDPVRQIAGGGAVADNGATAPAAAGAGVEQTQTPSPNATHVVVDNSTTAQPEQVASGSTTQPAGDVAEVASKAPASTQPTAEAEAEFDRLEAAYNDATQKPLEKQPVEELLAGYQKVSDGGALPESLRRICDFKIRVLKTRADAKAELAGAQKVNDSLQQKQMALQAEQGELETRVKQTQVVFYTAVGTLRPSSLQNSKETLYRLTDPANGRTVVYIRTNDTKIAQHLGEFIGVRGEVASDSQLNLRVISPTAFEAVNPGQVGQGVVAQIAPPSLLPAGLAGSATGNE